MTKADIVNDIQQKTGIDKATILTTVEAFMASVKENLAEVKGVVPFKAGLQILSAWNTEGSVLVHNVNENITLSNLTGSDSFDRKYHFLFVVKGRESLVVVESQFVPFRNFPYCDRNFRASFRFDG